MVLRLTCRLFVSLRITLSNWHYSITKGQQKPDISTDTQHHAVAEILVIIGIWYALYSATVPVTGQIDTAKNLTAL